MDAITFFHSGAYSSVIIAARPAPGVEVTQKMIDESLFGTNFVQLGEDALFFGLGSDAVGQPITYYIGEKKLATPVPERILVGSLISKGEPIFFEDLCSCNFDENSEQFYLPKGKYSVQFFSWNIKNADDNPDDIFDPNSNQVRHEVAFVIE